MDRDALVFLARVSEQAERFDEMADRMKAVAKLDQELSLEERNLLSVASKNIIGARRASWRTLSAIEQKDDGNEDHMRLAKEYKAKVEAELEDICGDILNIIDSNLIPKCTDDEAMVFYYKMKGDYFRYLAEFQAGEAKEASSGKALSAYKEADTVAQRGLATTHPIRLGLALNFSVFHYEIMNQPEEACKLAKQAFDGAISELDSLSEDSYKDSTLIMQLLRDNLTLWTSEEPNEE
eukprot:CAMPEP_0118966948 /NCGR_PEP_ID=MMETSP1173-20130426/4380_1 /TAXON_ID=1034831 /ORGANISM="Rhizochromulina marina cf, Strain CCMP1243" /LENGTH=236 /DNA_ID=CAMNT_0006915827 /DNA_START=118 /DNA_END=828 /DNA_ORIENTATION=+